METFTRAYKMKFALERNCWWNGGYQEFGAERGGVIGHCNNFFWNWEHNVY
jgi:hypothetical protein